jgi:catechol 2,3-dioxygenase-like lactoylglutathione lyase family enzyme
LRAKRSNLVGPVRVAEIAASLAAPRNDAFLMASLLPRKETLMQIARLDHLVLTVADIAKTCDFYTKVLGMEVVTFGEGRTALRFGQQKINLHPADDIPGLVADQPTAGSGDLCFITETPIAEVVTHLNKCGVPIITGPGPRAGAVGTIQSVYIRDPDQNLVEISNY